MKELISLVARKANISDTSAKTAVDTIVGMIRDRMPAPIAAQVETALSAGTGQTMPKGGMAADLGKGVGGMLGKK